MPGHDHAAIGYALDAGASIVVPQVDTVEQARHIVSATKFGAAINGTRSAPPGRFFQGFSSMECIDPSKTFWENLNEQAAIIIQIETLNGIKNLDEILTEVGEYIDSVWLGSLDCRASMGLPGVWGDEPEWLEAAGLLEATLKKHDKPYSGFVLGDEEVIKAGAIQKSFLMAAADGFALLGTAGTLATCRRLLAPRNYSEASKN